MWNLHFHDVNMGASLEISLNDVLIFYTSNFVLKLYAKRWMG